MVESAVSDIVACTVTTDDPLAACRNELLVRQEFLAMRAISSFHQRAELVSYLTGDRRVILILKPLLEESLDFI